jgi:hypothetical protein
MSCSIAARPSPRVVLDCIATNLTSTSTEVCAQPYVAVVETGALYSPHEPVCSSELEPRAHEQLAVRLDVIRELCRPERGGCVVHEVPLRADGTPKFEAVVGLARAMQTGARAAGRDQPSLAQCDTLLTKWSHEPAFSSYGPFLRADLDEVRVFCLGLSRATFECLRSASSSEEADACSPGHAALSPK